MKYSNAFDQTVRDSGSSGENFAHIEQLARETEMPIDLVRRLYCAERAKLEQAARIKTYVPVLVHRHVKTLLREQRAR